MHTFFLEDQALSAGNEVELSAEDLNHAYRVLRLRKGDRVALADGRGKAWLALIVYSGAQRVTALLTEELASAESPLKITLFQGLAKGDRFDLIVRQAVELGVTAIVPLVTGRSIPRWDSSREAKKVQRWRNIARSAASQCRRSVLPRVEAVHDIFLASEKAAGKVAFVLWECEQRSSLYTLLKQPSPRDRAVFIFIGPEGGFAAEEIEAFQEAGVVPASLGPRIMRVDTAAVSAITMAQAAWGDLSLEGE